MDETATEISKLNTKLDVIEQLLEKDYEEWTSKEKQKFGNHEQLRKKEQELLKQKTILLQKEQNQGMASEITLATAMDIDSTSQSASIMRSKSDEKFIQSENLDLAKPSD
ncbi:hypothetical protein HDV02_006647, partial [Globomyces sp. JEL0801]